MNAGFDSLCSGDNAAFAEYDRLLRDGNPVAMYNIWYVQSECGLYQDLSEIDIIQSDRDVLRTDQDLPEVREEAVQVHELPRRRLIIEPSNFGKTEDAGGEEVEFVLLALDDDGVAGVGSASDAGADVVFLMEGWRDGEHFLVRNEWNILLK